MAGAIGPHGPGLGGPRVRLVPGALEVAERAAGCSTWAELAEAAAGCVACPELAATRTTVVVGDLPAGLHLPGNWPVSNGLAGNGLAGDGLAGDGLAGDGLAGDGLAGDGPTGDGPTGDGPGEAGNGGQGPTVDRPSGGQPVRLALVGEAPGADEDRVGRPFVGRAGRLLDELLAEAGLDRADAAVLNVLQCRPPGNRTPKPAEIARCRGWLTRKLELLDPILICALGRTAAGWFLGNGTTLAAARGQVHDVAGRQVVVTYHPSAAIRYGPAGEPIAGLRADLALVADLLAKAPR